jgi:DNA repair exonuclease SbcCD ATPase subunit
MKQISAALILVAGYTLDQVMALNLNQGNHLHLKQANVQEMNEN